MPDDPHDRQRTWTTADEAATEAVGAELASLLPADATILLQGDLGVGKTVLVRGLCVALGVDRRQVQSPSYALIHEYQGTEGRVVHVDLYRLEPEEVPSLGLDELLEGPGFKAIEWGERLPEPLADAFRIRIETVDGTGRRNLMLTPP